MFYYLKRNRYTYKKTIRDGEQLYGRIKRNRDIDD